jgi:hypothetical protein
MGYELELIMGFKESENFLEISRINLGKIGNGLLDKFVGFSKGKSDSLDFKEFRFLEDVRGSDLGIDNRIAKFFNLGFNYTPGVIYEGGEEVKEDLYGEILPLVPATQILSIIKEELKYQDYRRFRLAKKMLEELTSSEWDGVYVIPFGC